ncbi:Uncharacterized protein APZ42_015177 [Daphnia magna]|uniref:Uncharacterized protein n=1 Tax=Daphnia magna TaxID=35525 RepID=A0A162P896_9CRUS|nr:Uncharacterized protein APZ42_015177 [Daphnia magna]
MLTLDWTSCRKLLLLLEHAATQQAKDSLNQLFFFACNTNLTVQDVGLNTLYTSLVNPHMNPRRDAEFFCNQRTLRMHACKR